MKAHDSIVSLSEKRRALLSNLLEKRGLHPSHAPSIPLQSTGSPPVLSFAQERMWVLDQLRPGGAEYNIAVGMRIEGLLDVPALGRSIGEIVQRHEVLRTGFSQEDGKPAPYIVHAVPLEVPLIDLSSLPPTEKAAEVERIRTLEAGQPFDLAQVPLLRLRLLRLGTEDHVLLLTLHHIVFDGWSLGLFSQELWALYEASVNHLPYPLPPLPLQYNDFALWQRAQLAGGAFADQQRYWTEQLTGAPDVLMLPSHRPRPPQMSFRGEATPFEIGAELTLRLENLAQDFGVSLYMLLLGALAILLARYSGVKDLIIGSPIANRHRKEIEQLMGLFVNTLALRLDLSGNPPFPVLMRRVCDVALGAYTNQDLPFEKIVEALRPQRSLGHSPLFQVFFVLQNAPRERDAPKGLRIADLGAPTMNAKFDLTLSVSETDDALHAHFEYSLDLFDRPTIGRMIENFKTLLDGIAATPEQRIGFLPLISEAEQAWIRTQWQQREGRDRPLPSVHERLVARAHQQGDSIALVEGEQHLTYRQLDDQTTRLAYALRQRGVGPDVLVGLCMPRCMEAVVALLAILKAGGAYVPLDPEHPPARLTRLLDSMRPAVVLTLTPFKANLPLLPVPLFCLDAPWDALPQAPVPLAPVSPDTLAYVLHTSGSTGVPKGVCIEHGALANYVHSILDILEFEPGMRCALVQPLTVDASLTTLWGCLCSGGVLHVIPSAIALDPHALVTYVERHRIDYLKLTPSHLQTLLVATDRLMPRQRLVLGGEAAPWAWFQQLQARNPDCHIYNQYGPAETTVGVLTYRLKAQGETDHFSVTPLDRRTADTEVHVLDEHGQPLPIGVTGEVYLGGACLARGYLGRPDLTEQRFIHPPAAGGRRLYRTGDLARFRPGGQLEYLGRADHQIKIRGFRVEPEEVRAVLVQHPQLQDALVVGRQSGDHTQHLLAYYVPHPDHAPSPRDLRHYLMANLPAHMVPTGFIALPEIPRGAHGKVDISTPPDPDLLSEEADLEVAPRDWLEMRLVRIWEELFQTAPIDVRHDFFHLGGHSLLAVRVMSRIQQELGKHLPISLLFQYSTIERLAASMRTAEQRPLWHPLVEMRAGQRRAPFFLVPGIGGNVLCFNALIRHLRGGWTVFCVQAIGLDGKAELPGGIEEMATTYLDAVRDVQPKGPYHLGGYSFGAKVVLEMALQLQQRGEEVAFLALFDGYPPDDAPLGNDHAQASRILAEVAREQQVAWDGEAVRALNLEDQIDHLKKAFEQAGVLPLGEGTPYVKNIVRVVMHHHRMRYQPASVYRGRITLFRTAEAVGGRALGWERHSLMPVEVHAVAGGHHTLLREPHVQELAKKVNTCLARLDEDLNA